MTLFALALLLTAAFIHATWNLLLKRAQGGPAFQWLFAVLSVGMYLPAVLVLTWYRPTPLDAKMVAVIMGAACCTRSTTAFCSVDTASATFPWSTPWPVAPGLFWLP